LREKKSLEEKRIMDSHSQVNVTGSDKDQDAKLMAELAREEARNAEALRMVKEKELQALAARDRAADSQRRMQDMMCKYDEMKQKLEWTRLTLEHTASQINQNDIKRAQQIQATVARLKEKAEHCSSILRMKRERDEQNASDILSGTRAALKEGYQAQIVGGSSLTESEKMLLLMCQTQAAANKGEQETVKEANKEHNTSPLAQNSEHDNSSLTDAEEILLSICQKEASAAKEEREYVTDTIKEELNTQENKTLVISEKKESDHDHGENEENKEKPEMPDGPISVEALDSIELADKKVSSPAKVEGPQTSEDVDLKEATKDLKETGSNIEAKSAGVRQELGQMAMSEQYMRTKQAQLHAKRREKEAEMALDTASKKEQEAQQMRQKVANMMKLLEERRNKLKCTENVLETRTNVVDTVNKVIESKHRKAEFVQKQRDESLAFDLSHQVNLAKQKGEADKHPENANEQAEASETEVEKSIEVVTEEDRKVLDDGN